MDYAETNDFLSKFRRRGALAERLKTSKKVPKAFRLALLAELEKRKKKNHDWGPDLENDEQLALGTAYGALSEKAVHDMAKALLPKLAAEIVEALGAMTRRTYQMGHERRPFRCPLAKLQVDTMRANWLLAICIGLGDYEVDVKWCAVHGEKVRGLGYGALPWLLVGALQREGQGGGPTLDVFSDIASGEIEGGEFSHQLIRACLSSNVESAWSLIERTLLAAQRQEGLRQAILECVDEAHPTAFTRMMRLIKEHNLGRFSATLRAVDVWFGFLWDQETKWKVDEVLDVVAPLLEDEAARLAAMASDDPKVVYLGLWAAAYHDVEVAVEHGIRLLAHPEAEHRYASVHLLTQSGWESPKEALISTLSDPDLRVANIARRGLRVSRKHALAQGIYGALEALLGRLEHKSLKLPPAVWPWTAGLITRADVLSEMFDVMTMDTLPGFLPMVHELDPWRRVGAIEWMTGLPSRWDNSPYELKPLEAPIYGVILQFLGDPSADARHAAFRSLGTTPVMKEEVERLEDLLRRKSSDLRTMALGRLISLPNASVVSVSESLMAGKTAPQRLAGLELARQAFEAERVQPALTALAEAYGARRKTITDAERAHLDVLTAEQKIDISRDDGLGLMDPAALRTWAAPEDRHVRIRSEAADACLESLAALVLEHKDTEVECIDYEGSKSMLPLLNAYHPALRIQERFQPGTDIAGLEASLPLRDVWRAWYDGRPGSMRGEDGLEFAYLFQETDDEADWFGPKAKELFDTGRTRWRTPAFHLLRGILQWMVRWSAPEGLITYGMDYVETLMSRLPETALSALRMDDGTWKAVRDLELEDRMPRILASDIDTKVSAMEQYKELLTRDMTGEESCRLYGFLRWFHNATLAYDAPHIQLDLFLAAAAAGAFEDENTAAQEFIDLMVGPASHRHKGQFLSATSSRKNEDGLAAFPHLVEARERVLSRVIEVECGRGDLPSEVSFLISGLRRSGGLDTLRAAMDALGKTPFARGTSWSTAAISRKDSLSHLISRSAPDGTGDELAAFAAWAKDTKVSDTKLVELGAFAPQWAGHAEKTLKWKGYEDAVWWIHAHTRDDNWGKAELKEEWAAEVSERTPLSAGDLTEGAVDVAWFQRAVKALGKNRWEVLFKAAKFASTSGGHTRAQLFAAAMGGAKKTPEIQKRIDDKRHQDSVRALGLVPLRGGKLRDSDLLKRYKRLADFRKESAKFGSQRQASEKRAVAIGMENLARTAGYRDPLRLTWAMERQAVLDLIEGPVTIERSDVAVTLSINAEGQPELAVRRGEKALKSIPKSHVKDPGFAALKERAKELRTQASRVKDVLETSMVRGDAFTGAELAELLEHPILGPSFMRCVFIGERAAGYPEHQGNGSWHLAAPGDVKTDVSPGEDLRLVHPSDLLARGDWHEWQADCFESGRTQPFKQVFRELYPITATEKSDGKSSDRYAGHQVSPRQALALLGGRGWVARPEEGVSQTFHDENLVARLEFQETFYTPADVEGLTLERVVFTEKSSYKPLSLDDVPPRLFSEVMRDLDLVVSVCHQGGVDPEATASTVEMRASLLRETCRLLGLGNVEVKEQNALIDGTRAKYSVHLGSAVARIRGSVALAIVAVHGQHRGRLFLPFADNDPRTAEVLSKVLLLARDQELKDPNLLAQIRNS